MTTRYDPAFTPSELHKCRFLEKEARLKRVLRKKKRASVRGYAEAQRGYKTKESTRMHADNWVDDDIFDLI